METEIQLLKAKIEELENRFITQKNSSYLDIRNIINLFAVVTSSTELTRITNSGANNLFDQIKIYNDGSTKKLYVYDYINNTWLSATLT